MEIIEQNNLQVKREAALLPGLQTGVSAPIFLWKLTAEWEKWIPYKPNTYKKKDGMLYAQKNSKELSKLLLRCKEDEGFCLDLPVEVQKGMILGLLDSDGNVHERSPNNITVHIFSFKKGSILNFISGFYDKHGIPYRKHPTYVSVSTKWIPNFVSKIGLPILDRKSEPLKKANVQFRIQPE